MISLGKRLSKRPIQGQRIEYGGNNRFAFKNFTSEDGGIMFLPDVGISLQNYRVIDLRILQYTSPKLFQMNVLQLKKNVHYSYKTCALYGYFSTHHNRIAN